MEVVRNLAKFFYSAHIPFAAVGNPHLKAAFDAAVKSNSAIRLPTRHQLSEDILEAEVASIWADLEGVRDSWKEFGCTIQFDGWQDKRGRHIYSIVVTNWKGPVFMYNEVPQLESRNAEWTVKVVEKAYDSLLQAAPGAELVQIVSDNASVNWAAWKILRSRSRFSKVIFSGCCAHIFDLALKHFGRRPYVSQVLEKNKVLVSVFKGVDWAKLLLENETDGKGLLSTGDTRFATNLLMLHRACDIQKQIRTVVNSDMWEEKLAGTRDNAIRAKCKLLKKIVFQEGAEHAGFWDKAAYVHNCMVPVLEAVRLADKDGPTAGVVYDGFCKAMSKLKEFIDTWPPLEAAEAHGLALLLHKQWHNRTRRTPMWGAARMVYPGHYGKGGEVSDETYTYKGEWMLNSLLLQNYAACADNVWAQMHMNG